MSIAKPRLWAPRRGLISPKYRHLWDGLIWAAFPGGDWRHDIISGGRGSLLHADTNWDKVSARGVAGEQTGTDVTGGFRYPWTDLIHTIDTEFTLAVWANITTWPDQYEPMLNCLWDTSWGEPFTHFTFERDATSSGWGFQFVDTGGTRHVVTDPTASAFDDAGDHLRAASRKGDLGSMYMDGLLLSSSGGFGTNSQGMNDGAGSQRTIQIGGFGVSPSTPKSPIGTFYAGLIWNRALSPQEHLDLYIALNTWEFLAPLSYQSFMSPSIAATAALDEVSFRGFEDDGGLVSA